MERYIGLDVHAQSCTLAVVSGTGRQLKREVVETNGAALKQALRAIPSPKKICLEEGTQSAWLYELLRGEADDVVVTMPAKRPGPKDDARDALMLAESLRTNSGLRRVYKSVGPYSELRAAAPEPASDRNGHPLLECINRKHRPPDQLCFREHHHHGTGHKCRNLLPAPCQQRSHRDNHHQQAQAGHALSPGLRCQHHRRRHRQRLGSPAHAGGRQRTLGGT